MFHSTLSISFQAPVYVYCWVGGGGLSLSEGERGNCGEDKYMKGRSGWVERMNR